MKPSLGGVRMRVGSSPFSAHQVGMSAAWRDVSDRPEKPLEAPPVQKGLKDMALPDEELRPSEGAQDPFQKMDELFAAAAVQMDRGRAGQAFLRGGPAAIASPAFAEHPDAGRRAVEEQARGALQMSGGGAPMENRVVSSVRADLQQVRMTNQAAATPITTTNTRAKGGTKTAAERHAIFEAPRASSVGDVFGSAAVFVPMAAGQAVQGVVPGPLTALASHAVSIASAVAGAGQIASIGIAEGLREEAPGLPARGALGQDQNFGVRRMPR